MATATAFPPLPAHLLASSLPTDYVRPFSFPLPKHKFVGVLACQRDPLARELVTRVVRCDKRVEPAPSTGKGSGKGQKGKKDKAEAPAVVQAELYEIELEDTVLFPEGGGQPSDAGTLVELSTGREVHVDKILRHGLSAVHYARGALPVGAQVRAIVDWDRRWDHMTQHTGQHVLSGLFDTLALPTLSWALTPSPQPCYIELPRAPTPAELAHVQRSANELIRAGVRVHVSLALADQTVRPETMPEDYVGGVVREVDIVGVDRGPCCGTHVPSLAALQSMHVFPYTSAVRGTNARVYFVVGPRVLEALGPASELLRQVGLELGCSTGEVGEKVREVVGAGKEARKREGRAREELAGYVAKEFLAERVEEVGNARTRVGVLVRPDEDSPAPLEFLSAISYKLRESLDAPESDSAGTPYLFALAASGPAGAPLVIFGAPDALVSRAGELVKARMGERVRGGGKGRWQGKRVDGRWTGEDGRVLGEIVREAAAGALMGRGDGAV